MSMVNFPEHWRMARFGEVATFTKKPRDLHYSEYDEVPFVPMDLIPIAELFSEKFTLKTNDELSSGTYFEPGDILLAKITPSFENGKQCIVEELPTPFGIATTEVIPIREVVGVSDKLYLFYFLLLPDIRTLLAGRMQGTTGRQRLGKETLVNLEIPLPPLPEQRAIAHVLGAIQEAKAARQRELALERERKAALVDYLFSYGTKGEPRKQTEIGEIPESWQLGTIGEICERIIDYRGRTPKFSESGIVHLRSSNVKEGRLTLKSDEITYVTDETYKSFMTRGLPKAGDIIFTTEGPLGESAMVPPNFRFSLAQRMVLLRADKTVLDSSYLLYVLYSEQVRRDYLGRATGSTAKGISSKNFQQVQVPLPCLTEQRKIAISLAACDAKIIALEQEVERLDELFHAMLDELMTGKRSAVPLIDAELPN